MLPAQLFQTLKHRTQTYERQTVSERKTPSNQTLKVACGRIVSAYSASSSRKWLMTGRAKRLSRVASHLPKGKQRDFLFPLSFLLIWS